ncbi:MAG TPA: MgtC/SapB family protein, partial [Deltaproteobacteria bacterium]|nr:MgtC/SapB family protein [Deltaproteobacteria bacterium]
MGVFLADFWTVIGVSVLCGGIVGLERQIRGKPAGIRTSIFICLGTSLFVSL